MCYTFEHSSVAKYLAIEQRETFSGQSSSKALAAILTMFRDVTSLVAMSANVNCRCFKIKNLFNQNVFPWFLSAYKCTKIHACIKRISTVVQLYLKMMIPIISNLESIQCLSKLFSNFEMISCEFNTGLCSP